MTKPDNKNTTRADIYSRVTDRIVEDLSKGVRPWLKPWSAPIDERMPLLPLRANGTPYRGINVLLLWSAAQDAGFIHNTWMTFKQATEHGAHVKKGEHGSPVVFADRLTRTEQNDNGEDIERQIPFMKAYTVFNVAQIEGLPKKFLVPPSPLDTGRTPELVEEAENFFTRTGARFQHSGNRAFYACVHDYIQLPPLGAFRGAESYTAIKAHELIHWTGHATRCAREFGYAREELVAELGAAFLCAELGITPEPREDHAAYLASWLTVLKEDKRAIFSAAAHAQRAMDHLHSLQKAEHLAA